MGNLKGLHMCLYPIMASNTHRKLDAVTGLGAPTSQEDSQPLAAPPTPVSDSDADEDLHDYVDGELPEALTAAYSVKSPLQKAAQLAADCMMVDSNLGLANTERRFLKRLVFEHCPDRENKTDSTHAMVLVPVQEQAGLKTACITEATMFKSGIYNNVPIPTTFLSVSRKAAFGAKRALDENWKYDKLEQPETGLRFAASKVSRGQLGEPLHECWMKDLVKTCNTKVLYICSFGSGSAEIEAAALNVKISPEAASQNVKICVWSHEPRKIFYEVGKARVHTNLGNSYMARKMSLPGHTPVPDPGDKPERSRRLVKALLANTPLKFLSVTQDGYLIVPTEEDVHRALGGQDLTPQAATALQSWREQFPRPVEPASGGDPPRPEPEPASGGDPQPNGDAVVATVGTKASKQDFENKYKLTAVASKPLPTQNQKNVENLEHVLAKSADNKRQCWLHNKSSKEQSYNIGMFLGKGGKGTFKSLVNFQLAEGLKPYSWKYTRISSHKRDSAELANAYLLYQGASASGEKFKPQTMHDLEKSLGNNITLYGHAITRGGKTKVTVTPSPTPVIWMPINDEKTDSQFSAECLAHWLPSMEAENASGPGKFEGYHRGIFEVQGTQKPPTGDATSTSWHLAPSAAPSAQALFIFTSKKIELAADEYFALGPLMS